MFGKIATVVLALLRSAYGVTTTVVAGVINTIVTGTFIVRQPGGTAGTTEVRISHNGTDALIDTRTGGIDLQAAGTNVVTVNSGGTITTNGNMLNGSAALTGTIVNSQHVSQGYMTSAQFIFSTSPGVGTGDTGTKRLAAAVIGTTNGAAGAGWLQITSGEARRTATQTVTDTTTFAADNTLSCTLIAARRYRFYIWYAFTTVNSSGVKLDLNGGGATMTAINGTITIFSSAMAVLAAAQITALTSTTGVTASGTLAFAGIEGSLECLGAGTFIPRFAQNTETGAAESVIAQIGSYITLADVP